MNNKIKNFRKNKRKIRVCGMGADGLYVDFPDYGVDTGIPAGPLKKVVKTTKKGNIESELGHGMVIAVDENTGQTRGSEYGRYDSENKGIARRVRVPSFQMADPGNPTQEELDAYARALDKAYGHSGGTTRVSYIKGADYNKLVDLMKSAETNDRENGFYVNHDYRILGHNCGSYAADMLKKAMPWFKFSGFGPYSWGQPGGMEPYFTKRGIFKQEKK